MLSKGRQPDALPPPSRLEAAVRNLAARGDHRALIQFVEQWSTLSPPTDEARLAEARAFLALSQVDRAWIRLQTQAQAPDASLDVLTTAAEIFLARGWPAKARQYLNRALADAPDDARLQALWDAAAQPAEEPEPPRDDLLWQAADPEVAEELVALAAEHLRRGHRVVGKSVLERVLHALPDHPRAQDLLWAMKGDPTPPTATLDQLTERYAPVMLPLGDFLDENTESITAEGEIIDLDDRGSSSFPLLFRGSDDEAVDPTETTDEVTRSMVHIGSVPLAEDDAAVEEEEGPSYDGEEGDPRIMRVRGRDGVPEPIHHGDPTPDSGFDLNAFREEMGMTPVRLGVDRVSAFGTSLEDEDDELVVLTGRERGTPQPVGVGPTPTTTQIGREVAHLMGGRPPETPAPPISAPDPSVVTPAPVRSAGRGREGQVPADPVRPTTDRSSRKPLWPWLVVLGLVAVSGLGAVAVLLLGFFVSGG